METIGNNKDFELAAKALHQDWTPEKVHHLIKVVDDFIAAALASQAQDAPVGAVDDLETLLTTFDIGLGFALCHRDFGDMRNAVKKLQQDFTAIRAAVAQRAASVEAKPVTWPASYTLKPGEKIFYSALAQTRDGLPIMSDSDQHGAWDVAMVFEGDNRRPKYVWGFDDTDPSAAAKVAQPEFSRDPDGDLALDWAVGDASLSMSFSKTGAVSWATNVAGKSDSGAQQVAQDSGRDAARSEDTELLDWFDTQVEAYGCDGVQEGNRWAMDGPFRDLRHALKECKAYYDAAMAAQPKKDN